MTTVAIMQPYFIPYAGYFRLFAASDLFVILDCVQFPRTGWVHRNRLTDRNGNLIWLTLPLEKAPQRTTLIRDLHFRVDAGDALREQARRFPLFDAPANPIDEIATAVLSPSGSVVDHIAALLEKTCAMLKLPFNVIRSSALDIDPGLRGWERIVAIARRQGADTYLNAPGGIGLYDLEDFRRSGVTLRFLVPYQGATASVLQRLHDDGVETVRKEILGNTTLVPQ